MRYLALAGVLALGGCVLPGGGGKTAAPNPVTGGDIEVMPLDAVPSATTATAKAEEDPTAQAAVTPAAASAKAPAAGDTRPKPRPAAALSAAAEAPVAAPAVPEAAKSPAQIACERKKGLWSKAGKGGFACVSKTRDSGKECRNAKQCEGECLARSGTCAPIKPLFGCNEILDDMGRRTTLCID